jgi:polysaccharide transporter, PST family
VRNLFDDSALRGGLKARTVRGMGVTMAMQAILFGTQFLGTVLLARLLTPVDFGLIGMAVAVTGVLETFKDLGLSMATIQQKQITPGQVSVLFWFNVLIGCALFALGCGLAPGLAWFYGREELLGITLALSLGFLLAGLSAQHYALLRRNLRFASIARVEVTASVVSLAAGLTAAWQGLGFWSLVVQRLTRPFIMTCGIWLAAGWLPRWFKWDPSVKPMLRFGGFLAGNNLLNYAARNVDNVAIGYTWGAAALGLYSRAYNLLMLPMSQVAPSLATVVIPALSRLRDEPEKFRHAYLTLVRLIGFTMVPLMAVLLVCPEAVITLLLGEKWLAAAEIFRWLGVAALIQPMTTTCGILFITHGRSKEMSQCTLITSLLAVTAIVAAVPWGPAAVAGSYAISGLLIRTPVLFRYAGRISRVTTLDLYRAVIPSLLIAGLVVAAGLLSLQLMAPGSPLTTLLVAATAGLGVIAGAALFLPGQRAVLREAINLMNQLRRNVPADPAG